MSRRESPARGETVRREPANTAGAGRQSGGPDSGGPAGRLPGWWPFSRLGDYALVGRCGQR